MLGRNENSKPHLKRNDGRATDDENSMYSLTEGGELSDVSQAEQRGGVLGPREHVASTPK